MGRETGSKQKVAFKFFSAFLNSHQDDVLKLFFTALAWLVPHETAAVLSRSVYTICHAPCHCHFIHAKPHDIVVLYLHPVLPLHCVHLSHFQLCASRTSTWLARKCSHSAHPRGPDRWLWKVRGKSSACKVGVLLGYSWQMIWSKDSDLWTGAQIMNSDWTGANIVNSESDWTGVKTVSYTHLTLPTKIGV